MNEVGEPKPAQHAELAGARRRLTKCKRDPSLHLLHEGVGQELRRKPAPLEARVP